MAEKYLLVHELALPTWLLAKTKLTKLRHMVQQSSGRFLTCYKSQRFCSILLH